MTEKVISEAVVKRLPRYYRYLQHLEQEGVKRVSSKTIAQLLDITASQVRQDFCNFGGFGQQGYGYDVPKLKSELASILGLDRTYSVIIIGAGNIGRALASYGGFEAEGFIVKAAFDVRPVQLNNGVKVYDISMLEDYIISNPTDIAVIATQKECAIETANRVVSCGVNNIWNFAPIDLVVPKHVVVENISMSESLFVLSYRMHNRPRG